MGLEMEWVGRCISAVPERAIPIVEWVSQGAVASISVIAARECILVEEDERPVISGEPKFTASSPQGTLAGAPRRRLRRPRHARQPGRGSQPKRGRQAPPLAARQAARRRHPQIAQTLLLQRHRHTARDTNFDEKLACITHYKSTTSRETPRHHQYFPHGIDPLSCLMVTGHGVTLHSLMNRFVSDIAALHISTIVFASGGVTMPRKYTQTCDSF